MKFKDLIIENYFLFENVDHTYRIFINGFDKERKQEFLDCINELIQMDKYEIEIKNRNRQKLPDNSLDKSFTYSKYDVLQIFKTLKTDDFHIKAFENKSYGATGYVWILKVNKQITKNTFEYETLHGMYLKVMFQNNKEPRHSRNGLSPKNGDNFIDIKLW